MSNEFCPGNFAVVTDYLDKGNFPAIISMREYFQFRSINWNLAKHLSKRLGERLGQDHIYSDETTLIQFDGPALPSNANIKLGKYTGCQLYTIANLSAINHCASLGIHFVLLSRILDWEFYHEVSEH